jgi:catechol 2,3-dioxygenase-like lactoylglutathione lyase family enzyme
VSKLSHIGVVVKDVERSKEFYKEFCGCEPVKLVQDERYKLQFLDVDGQTIILLQLLSGDPEEARRCGVVDHIAFQVEDIDSAVDKLRSAGVKLQMEKPQVEIIGAKIFYFFGPDGERLEYVQTLGGNQ